MDNNKYFFNLILIFFSTKWQCEPFMNTACNSLYKPWTYIDYLPFSIPQVFQTSQVLEDPPLHLPKLPKLPIATAGASAIVIERNVYVCGGFCPKVSSACVVQVYNLDRATWTKLPHPAPQFYSEAVAIKDELVLIGGREASSCTITNMVSTWSEQGWENDMPRMPTKRSRPGVATYSTYVVVAGGMAEDRKTLLSSIDVLDTTTRHWSTAANLQLPRPMYCMKIAVCGTHIYVASAAIKYDAATDTGTSSKSVLLLPVATLEKVCSTGHDSLSHLCTWTEITPTPNYCSALLQNVAAQALAVGGFNSSHQPTPDIVMYDPHSNKWLTVGQLLEPRAWSAVVSISRHSILVLGGLSNARNKKTLLRSAEVVSLP